MTADLIERPPLVKAFTVLLVVAALLTGYFGLSAKGYLVPAAVSLGLAALLWWGRWPLLFRLVLDLNVLSGALMFLVIWYGGFLGKMKLDVSGVMMIVNVVTGGPLMAVVGPPIVAALRLGKALPAWFAANDTSKGREARA